MRKTVNGLAAAGIIGLTAVCGFGGTYAYFTYLREMKNRFTVGHNEITVTEEYDPPDEIIPGEETSFFKKVQVENTGSVPCYVRVRLEYSDSDMKQFCTNLNEIKMDSYTKYPTNNYDHNYCDTIPF